MCPPPGFSASRFHSGEIEADIEDGDKQFSRTHSQVARVLEQLKPAERYLAEVAVNKDYFAGATTELRLSKCCRRRIFDPCTEVRLTQPFGLKREKKQRVRCSKLGQ